MESWRRAAPRGAASHLWTKCPEVGQTKCACATQSHASARNNKFIYVLPNFTFTAGLILLDGWAFFDRLGGGRKGKRTQRYLLDTAVSLKKGDFNTPPVFSFFKKKTAALISQNRRQATVLCQGGWIPSRQTAVFIIPFSAVAPYV